MSTSRHISAVGINVTSFTDIISMPCNRVRTGPGKPGKSWNLIIFQAWKVMDFVQVKESHGLCPGQGKSWKLMLANINAAELPTVLDCPKCLWENTLNYGKM